METDLVSPFCAHAKRSNNTSKCSRASILVFYILMFLMPTILVNGDDRLYTYSGFIFNNDGLPVDNATVLLVKIDGITYIPSIKVRAVANGSGYYYFTTIEHGALLAYMNDSTTPGFDYYPSLITQEHYTRSQEFAVKCNFTLVPAATIKLIGEFKSVQHEIYIFYPEFLYYGKDLLGPPEGQYQHIPWQYKRILNRITLELDSQTVLAPAGEFYLELCGYTESDLSLQASAAQDPSYSANSELFDGDPLHLLQGEVREYDVSRLCLHQDLNDILSLHNSTRLELLEAHTAGYNIEEDQERLHDAELKTSNAALALTQGEYNYAYNNLTESYSLLSTINENLENYEKTPTGIPGFPIMSVIIGSIIGIILLNEIRNQGH